MRLAKIFENLEIIDGNKVNLSDFDALSEDDQAELRHHLSPPRPSDIPLRHGVFGSYQSESEPFAILTDDAKAAYDEWLWSE